MPHQNLLVSTSDELITPHAVSERVKKSLAKLYSEQLSECTNSQNSQKRLEEGRVSDSASTSSASLRLWERIKENPTETICTLEMFFLAIRKIDFVENQDERRAFFQVINVNSHLRSLLLREFFSVPVKNKQTVELTFKSQGEVQKKVKLQHYPDIQKGIAKGYLQVQKLFLKNELIALEVLKDPQLFNLIHDLLLFSPDALRKYVGYIDEEKKVVTSDFVTHLWNNHHFIMNIGYLGDDQWQRHIAYQMNFRDVLMILSNTPTKEDDRPNQYGQYFNNFFAFVLKYKMEDKSTSSLIKDLLIGKKGHFLSIDDSKKLSDAQFYSVANHFSNRILGDESGRLIYSLIANPDELRWLFFSDYNHLKKLLTVIDRIRGLNSTKVLTNLSLKSPAFAKAVASNFSFILPVLLENKKEADDICCLIQAVRKKAGEGCLDDCLVETLSLSLPKMRSVKSFAAGTSKIIKPHRKIVDELIKGKDKKEALNNQLAKTAKLSKGSPQAQETIRILIADDHVRGKILFLDSAVAVLQGDGMVQRVFATDSHLKNRITGEFIKAMQVLQKDWKTILRHIKGEREEGQDEVIPPSRQAVCALIADNESLWRETKISGKKVSVPCNELVLQRRRFHFFRSTGQSYQNALQEFADSSPFFAARIYYQGSMLALAKEKGDELNDFLNAQEVQFEQYMICDAICADATPEDLLSFILKNNSYLSGYIINSPFYFYRFINQYRDQLTDYVVRRQEDEALMPLFSDEFVYRKGIIAAALSSANFQELANIYSKASTNWKNNKNQYDKDIASVALTLFISNPEGVIRFASLLNTRPEQLDYFAPKDQEDAENNRCDESIPEDQKEEEKGKENTLLAVLSIINKGNFTTYSQIVLRVLSSARRQHLMTSSLLVELLQIDDENLRKALEHFSDQKANSNVIVATYKEVVKKESLENLVNKTHPKFFKTEHYDDFFATSFASTVATRRQK